MENQTVNINSTLTIAHIMTDDRDKISVNKNKEVTPKLDLGDWSPDYFPTSPQIVFKKSLILVLFLGILCILLAIWSKSDIIDTKSPSLDIQKKDIQEEQNSESDIF